LRQKGSQSALVVGLTGVFGLQEIKQIVRSWQAADMRCLNVVGILLQGHRLYSGRDRPVRIQPKTCSAKTANVVGAFLGFLVGAAGFEPTTQSPRRVNVTMSFCERSTRYAIFAFCL
jgi:hypothetical protein